ncbi:TPA_asm: hypothetical protein GJF97_23020 [Salmonella enterica subsp. enterica serovar Enteritidis]|nr:hypothetical protein [Salmonella enterica subsp. enterica serovar Enteritidis]HAC9312141.1 hypothetical protein [Salmonella enterica subsp. enterica serovar Typhimurium]
MITKEQATHLMVLVDAVADTSADMVRAVVRGGNAKYVAASLERDLAYQELMAFVDSITEQSGCRKEDARGCEHDWAFYDTSASMMCRICGLKK